MDRMNILESSLFRNAIFIVVIKSSVNTSLLSIFLCVSLCKYNGTICSYFFFVFFFRLSFLVDCKTIERYWRLSG